MKRAALLVLAALGSAAAAQPAYESAPAPSRARWDFQTVNGQRYLRATANDGDGPGKLMFICNDHGRLVVMATMDRADADAVAAVATGMIWVIDGTPSPDLEAPGGPVIVTEGSLMSMIGLGHATYRRVASSGAAGVVWLDNAGGRRAGFQIGMAEGRAPLAAFARECNAQIYP